MLGLGYQRFLGDPAEFLVAKFADIDLRDNGLGPWLDSGKATDTPQPNVGVDVKKAAAVASTPVQVQAASKPAHGGSPKLPLKVSAPPTLSSVMDVPGTELKSSFLCLVVQLETVLEVKGLVMDDFMADSVDGVHVGSVYVKDLRAHVAVSVHGAVGNTVLGFKEGRIVEMRGVLYEEGTSER